MSANLYATKNPNEYYHIHGSLEASTTLGMIGLEPYRPDLATHEEIVETIGSAVSKFTVDELEKLNTQHRQAGIKAFTHAEFLKTPHVSRGLDGRDGRALHMALADDINRAKRTLHFRHGQLRS